MRLLDLFSGAGGSGLGYSRSGFDDITGVDIEPMPRYPFNFVQADAIEYAAEHWSEFDAIHASPPCQRFSKMSACRPGIADNYPDLIAPTRELLTSTGLPYVIENVPGAPLIDPVMLCGSHFNLTAWWPKYGRVGLRRHRLFETNFPLPQYAECDHSLYSVPVYGGGPSGDKHRLRGEGCAQAGRDVMGIDWMTRDEIDEALPPAYTEYIGRVMLAHAYCWPFAA